MIDDRIVSALDLDVCGVTSWQLSLRYPRRSAVAGIGLSAVLLMLLTGRIAGISGIFGDLLDFRSEDKVWRIAFIAELILAPLIAGLIGFAMPSPELPGS